VNELKGGGGGQRKKKFEVLKRRTMREAEGMRELLPWVLKALPAKTFPSSAQSTLYKTAAEMRRNPPAEARLQKAPRSEGKASRVDIATAAFLSIEPFHVVDESEAIVGRPQTVLRSWLTVLGTLGLDTSGTDALERLAPNQNPISYQEWDTLASRFRMGGRVRKGLQWEGCKGSGRGYPCGLWTLFHAAVQGAEEKAPAVLRVIRDYMAVFFKCEECAMHFAQEAHALEAEAVDHVSSVLWLWRIHNSVNTRTGPRYGVEPALYEYPSVDTCPDCRTAEGKWDEAKVLVFMRRIYSVATESREEL